MANVTSTVDSLKTTVTSVLADNLGLLLGLLTGLGCLVRCLCR